MKPKTTIDTIAMLAISWAWIFLGAEIGAILEDEWKLIRGSK